MNKQMQLDDQTKNHQATQKNAERYAVETLTPSIYEALGLTNSEPCNVKDAEEPDFIFGYRDKSIGVEVIECHPSTSKKKKDNAPALKSFKEKICKSFLKNLYLESITKGDNKIRIIIDFDNALSTKYSVESLCAAIEYYLRAFYEGKRVGKGRVIRGIRVFKTIGKNIVQFNNIGRVDSIECSSLCKCIEAKNKLFDAYTKKHPCSEYWLCIYLPSEEYRCSYNINYDESGNRLHKLLRKSKFSRICVTSSLHCDLRWLKGDPAPKYMKCRKSINEKKIKRRVSRAMNLKKLRELRTLYGI